MLGESNRNREFNNNRPYKLRVINPYVRNPQAMLTEIYIEALLVDEDLADQIWEAWDPRRIGYCACVLDLVTDCLY